MEVYFGGLIQLVFLCAYFKNSQQNIVLILTDDQDYTLGGLDPMKNVNHLLGKQGTFFTNAFVTTPICCPSRSSILTGMYAHNHGTINNSITGGCNGQHWQKFWEHKTFVTYLHSLGYKTFYAGKYLNTYGSKVVSGSTDIPPGWDWWIGLIGNSKYYNYSLSVNGSTVHYSDQYLTDLIKEYAIEFLRQKHITNNKFLMVLAPPSPHAPFTPSEIYKDIFKGIKAPRTPNFNKKIKSTKHWLLRLGDSPLPENFISSIDHVFQRRWETLMSVDDLVKSMVNELKKSEILEDTFVIFSSDNGFHMGQFSQPWDKRQPYESDIRIPLIIRGPGIPQKRVISCPVLNIDIAPTILDMASVNHKIEFDGESFFNLLRKKEYNCTKRKFLIEYNGEGGKLNSPECGYPNDGTLKECSIDNDCKCQDSTNNTFRCIRSISELENFVFCQFEDCENFLEAYNLRSDPFQLNNVATTMKEKKKKILLNELKILEICKNEGCKKL